MGRGQITIFIILGILLLASLSVFLFVRERGVENKPMAPKNAELAAPIKLFEEECLREGLIDGLYYTFARGGYYNPADYSVLARGQVPFFIADGIVEVPTIEKIASETAKATEKSFSICIAGFKTFKDKGYSFETAKMKTKVSFENNDVFAELDYPIKIMQGDKSVVMDKISVRVPFGFVDKYEDIDKFVEEQQKNLTFFNMGLLSEIAYKHNYEFGVENSPEDNSVLQLNIFYDEDFLKKPLVFKFAIAYPWVEERLPGPVVQTKSPLILKTMPDWNITTPGIHTYKVNAEGEGLKFMIDTDAASISEDGIITLNAASFANGEYLTYVGVEDKAGRMTGGPLVINVMVDDGKVPAIKSLPPNTAIAGKEFRHKITLKNYDNQTRFFVDSRLFDIDENTGEIIFTPTENEVGNYSMRFDVLNKFGVAWTLWNLEIRGKG